MNANQPDPEVCRRHTASHIMSAAVMMLRPNAKRGVGPWTDEGFYQDFALGEEPLSEADFKKVEKKMRWIVNKDLPITRMKVDYKTAKKMFAEDAYKAELIEDLKAGGETVFSYYTLGDKDRPLYTDLCNGPHLESTGKVGVFRLTKVAGAYWRGDSTRPMLTRLYGVAFPTQEELDYYEEMLVEAERRDHRKLGAELDLFCFSDKVGSGLPLFTPKGTFLRDKIADTIQSLQAAYGYDKVNIPHITKKDLYECSGHWDKFKEDLFHVKGKGDTEFVMKPMNCPHHAQIFAARMRSYRELPVRYAEVTTCYRDELPGELLGLSRVRSLTQDDGHVFCRLSQVKQESKNIVKVIQAFYTKLGMWEEGSFWVSLSVRDLSTPEKYLGDPKDWDQAEAFLEEVAKEEKLECKRVEGEAAFYGPKLDFQFKDALGRQWQLATVQIDFVQPERFGLEYINEKGEKERPVMIHRAVAGSLERFLAVIIEHFGGVFPLWLAPVQAAVLPVNTAQEAEAQKLVEKLNAAGARVEFWDSSETLGKRIRLTQTQKLPLAIILGEKETKGDMLTLRRHGQEKDEQMSRSDLQQLLTAQ